MSKAKPKAKIISREVQEMALRVASATQQRDEAVQTMNTMFDCLGQALLLVDLNGICQPIYSKACESLLEIIPAGLPIGEVLKVPPGKRPAFDSWLRMLLEERIAFNDLVTFAPKLFPHSARKYVVLEFRAIRNPHGELKFMLMIATDRTNENSAKMELEEKARDGERIVKIVRERAQFLEFIAFCRQSATRMRHLDSALEPTKMLSDVKRLVHSIKGEAAGFLLDDLFHSMRVIEEHLEKPLLDYAPIAIHLDERIDRFLTDYAFLIGDPAKIGRTREIYNAGLVKFIDALSQFPDSDRILTLIAQTALATPALILVENFITTFRDLMKATQKKAKVLRIEGGETLVPRDPYGEVFANLIHIFRFLADSGIETPVERLAMGKDMAAEVLLRIQTLSENSNDTLQIEVEYNGYTIDKRTLENLFATQPGLSAFRLSIESFGGTLQVESSLGLLSRFVISLPLSWAVATAEIRSLHSKMECAA